MTEIAKRALKHILDYIGDLDNFKDNAQLITYIEQAIKQALKETL